MSKETLILCFGDIQANHKHFAVKYFPNRIVIAEHILCFAMH